MKRISAILNGGGLRVLALLLAGILACAPLMAAMPGAARAADENQTLYIWDGDRAVKDDTLPAGVTITDMGLAEGKVCLAGSDGNTYSTIWANSGINMFRLAKVPCQIRTRALDTKAFAGHSARGSVTPDNGDVTGYHNINGSVDRDQMKVFSVDAEGRLWVGGDKNSMYVEQDSDDIEFTMIAWGLSSSTISYSHVFLLGKPRARTQAATVAAVPTTGAPSSDLILPAALLAAGMIGGGLIVRRRKDRSRA